jgi:NAD(P)-dependent dehydrogenase (short-subunit alcohol dehydrogenase family)
MKLSEARHAFVTGGASGIGLGIAQALAARGITVTIADLDAAALERAAGGKIRGVVLDVRDREGWARAKAEAEAAAGPVDILVNNAGIGPDGSTLADVDPVVFDRVIAINLTGVYNGIATFAAGMRERGRGHIVSTSSVAGLFADSPGTNAYAAAKFGVTAMSETLRSELAPHGVGVSVLCPGFVVTNIIANTARINGETNDYDGGGMPSDALTPADVAKIVLEAIEADQLYIISSPELWPMVEGRLRAVEAAFVQARGETAA